MKVEWTSASETDRAAAVEYVAQDSPLAAIALDDRFDEVAALLSEHPFAGRLRPLDGLREFVADRSHKVVYEIGTVVRVLAVVHAAQEERRHD